MATVQSVAFFAGLAGFIFSLVLLRRFAKNKREKDVETPKTAWTVCAVAAVLSASLFLFVAWDACRPMKLMGAHERFSEWLYEKEIDEGELGLWHAWRDGVREGSWRVDGPLSYEEARSLREDAQIWFKNWRTYPASSGETEYPVSEYRRRIVLRAADKLYALEIRCNLPKDEEKLAGFYDSIVRTLEANRNG